MYGADVLSCAVVGSAMGLYQVALQCCYWSCDGAMYISVGFCRAEEKYWLARMELR